MNKLTFYCAALALFFSQMALACLHFDHKFKHGIEEGTKAALLFADERGSHLVVRTDLKSRSGLLPKRVAWVMPFPSLPSKYEEVEESVFTEVERLAITNTPGMKSPVTGANAWSRGLKGADSFRVHAVKTVGNYKITPIEILTLTDGKEFNAWLEARKFNSMPVELQKPYLKPGTVFLAIEVSLKSKTAQLKPIHITYPKPATGPALTFPLRFTHNTRTFDFELYVITPEPIDALTGIPKYFDMHQEVALAPVEISEKTYPQLHKLLGKTRGHLSHFSGIGLNKAGKPLAQLAADPSF